MKAKGFIIYGVIAYLFFLAATFPAAKAYAILSRQMGKNVGQFVLTGIKGPWWSGEAAGARIGLLQVQNLQWRFKPLALITGQVSASVKCKTSDGYVRGILAKGVNSLSAKNVTLRLPLDLFNNVAGMFGVNAKGYFAAQIKRVKIKKGYLAAADGTLIWNGAGMDSPQKLTLGDFKADSTTEKDGIRLTFNDNGGPLKAQGVLRIDDQGAYTFSATFVALDKKQPTLSDMLSLLGNMDDNGKVTVSRNGKLPLLPS